MSKDPRHGRQRHSLRSRARAVTLVASALALVATTASVVLVAGAQGGTSKTAAQRADLRERAETRRSIDAAAKRAPIARGARCVRTTIVRGQGRSCRTPDGLWLVPRRGGGEPLMTHGPDVVGATGRVGGATGFGSPDSIVCSPASRSRHVVLLYLLPADYATGTGAVHGDRFAEVADQMRQALYDASAVVDARAGELSPGARRRIRVLCEDDGRPVVERVVLPHTSAEYLEGFGGFSLLTEDLEKLGHLPSYADYTTGRLPAVRRVLSYYDADFHVGIAGQGTMFRRSSLLRQGTRANSPLLSRSVRNINNNPPSASFAVQYGSRNYDGAIEPPLYTNLLHELAHTMGAVQDEPPTSSLAGHCTDGLDIMCYHDGGTRGAAYVDTACPDAEWPAEAADEHFDCNGDTYFHPAPPADNPLSDSKTWHLGLPANETFARTAASPPRQVGRVRAIGAAAGTRRVLRWPAVKGAKGYEVAWRRPGGTWEYQFVSRPTAVPLLRPRLLYEVKVAAVGPDMILGQRRALRVRAGRIDNTPPLAPTSVRMAMLSSTAVRLRLVLPADNVRVTRIRVERQSGRRWVPHATLAAPSPRVAGPGDQVVSPMIRGLRPRTTYRLRLRAIDGRGNLGAPSVPVRLRTR